MIAKLADNFDFSQREARLFHDLPAEIALPKRPANPPVKTQQNSKNEIESLGQQLAIVQRLIDQATKQNAELLDERSVLQDELKKSEAEFAEWRADMGWVEMSLGFMPTDEETTAADALVMMSNGGTDEETTAADALVMMSNGGTDDETTAADALVMMSNGGTDEETTAADALVMMSNGGTAN